MKIARLLLASSLLTLTACPEDAPPPATPKPVPSADAPATAKLVVPPGTRPPVAEKKPVVDSYHGVSVTDDYRWLENGEDTNVKQWSAAQNTYARGFLDKAPARAQVEAELTKIMTFTSPAWYFVGQRGGRLFAFKDTPPKQQPSIVMLKDASSPDSEKIVFDPLTVDNTGGTSMDWIRPSFDGKLLAVSLAAGGSESGTLHVYDVDGGKEHTIDSIPRVNGGTAGGDVAWLKDGSGFYYTRYPSPNERPKEDLEFYQEVWFHKLGTDPKTDFASLPSKSLMKIAEIELRASDDGRFLLASVANGDGGEFEQWVLALGKDPKADAAKWQKVAGLADKVVEAKFAPDGELYVRSKKDASKGKILKLAATSTIDKATVVVPEGDAVIERFTVGKTKLYVDDLVGGPHRIRLFDRAGKTKPAPELEPVSSVYGIVPLDNDTALVHTQSFINPGVWNVLDDGKMKPTPFAKKSPIAVDDLEVVRETCTSKDGTKVPVSIIRKKGTKLDGSNRALVTGYGGYGLSQSPFFYARGRVWLDRGGVVAETNIRGGGEFGEKWHTDGNLLNKQHVFDDFAACGQHMIDAKYTHSSRMAAIGGSNGGLLMGATATQQPNLFGTIVSYVGMYDMLRSESMPNGVFNTTEFGSVKDKAQFDAMYAYSPYHHVKDGTAYPAMLLLTGENDPRVAPYESRKMVARLQAASPQSTVLLRTSGNSGHGIGTPLAERIAQEVDVFSFLLEHTEK